MDITKILKAILNKSESSEEIIQTLSKSDLDEVIEVLYQTGIKIVEDQLTKQASASQEVLDSIAPESTKDYDSMGYKLHKAEYKVPGVTHLGLIPKDHPEHQAVVNHINKLMTLPDNHPLKSKATAVAKDLYNRHVEAPRGSVILPPESGKHHSIPSGVSVPKGHV